MILRDAPIPPQYAMITMLVPQINVIQDLAVTSLISVVTIILCVRLILVIQILDV
jgi:hypothetical protein